MGEVRQCGIKVWVWDEERGWNLERGVPITKIFKSDNDPCMYALIWWDGDFNIAFFQPIAVG
jgi:hypothetical protein